MSLPLPRVVSDVGPGGPLVTAMGGINSLQNDMMLRRINEIKAQYAPMTAQADAASKMAYANLMGPQFLAKLMGNDSALANMSEDQKKQALAMLYRSGAGQGTGNAMMGGGMPQQQGSQGQSGGNPFSMPQPQQNPSLSGWLTDKIKNIFSGGQQSPQGQQQPSQNAFSYGNQSAPSPQETPVDINKITGNSPQSEIGQATTAWMNSPEALAQAEKEGMYSVPPKDKLLNWFRAKQGGTPGTGADRGMAYDKNGNNVIASPSDIQQPQAQPTYAENTGAYKGTVKEGEELGKHRADVINEIGNQQLQLSNTGANLDRIVSDINDPKFMALRKDFPFYQDMQLTALSKLGTPEQQEMIGNFIADVKSFAGSTVNSFKGQSMKREFDYADQLKPSENDTVNTARGKLTALKSLKDIAEQKNEIILDLMQNKHKNLGDAVKQANKMVDIKAIDKQVKELTQPQITIKNKKTGESITVSLKRAREMGVPNV